MLGRGGGGLWCLGVWFAGLWCVCVWFEGCGVRGCGAWDVVCVDVVFGAVVCGGMMFGAVVSGGCGL